jgi:hypothetical protein
VEEKKERIRSGVPLGFKDRVDVKALSSTFEKEMAAIGNRQARLAIRGSAVTNRSFEDKTQRYTGHPFDQGNKPSDLDFAIVDTGLFNRALRAGIEIAPTGTRTLPLYDDDLKKVGLEALAESVKGFAGKRSHSFVIYASERAVSDRGPVMWLPGGK